MTAPETCCSCVVRAKSALQSRVNATVLNAAQGAIQWGHSRSSRSEKVQYFCKETFILDRCKGKRVLHLGCVGFTDSSLEERIAQAKNSLHWKLSRIADVVGVDYSASVVEEYRRLGIFDNILVGNVMELEKLGLQPDFDAIVAGDIIEHVSNPGNMLAGIRSLASAKTELILTTPNSFGLPNFLRNIVGRFHEGGEHVMGFNDQQLTCILSRHGLRVKELHTCFQRQARQLHGAFTFAVARKFFSVVPKLGGTLLAVAQPVLSES
jgi:2-polyprenyl-3-methyl-5-hydroxy-6-metoxy-1,4-benzoquinol methylase